MRFITPARIDTSSMETGSSAMITFGFRIIARAIAKRCRCPQPGPDLAAILAPLLPDHDSTLGRRLEAGDQTARGGLAAPAFTYEAENLAPTEIKGDPVHRANVDSVAAEGLKKASSELEVLLQALDVDDDVLV